MITSWFPFMTRPLRRIGLGAILACAFLLSGFSGTPEKYSEVRIFVNTHDQIQALQNAGLYFDHVKNEKTSIRTILNSEEMAVLRRAGVSFEIVIDDVVADYERRTAMTAGELRSLERRMKEDYGIDGFGYGSMGGFYTNAEVNGKLDSMHIQYPNLTTQKDSIGTTIEGRKIYAIKISSNPGVNDTSKPEIIYTSLIHAREPQSMMTLIYYMYYLLENYGVNEEVTYLLDHRQLWFIPVINPDGYVYNQTTNPNGGGLYRKNRRNGNNGIDLNRNFGTYEYWNSPNGGSSTDPSSDTYRGTAPFSEPETGGIRDFVNAHRFRTGLNYHTYSNLLIYPWAWIDPQLTPDSSFFTYWANEMTAYNGYEPGTASQTVGYFVRGGTDDWMYGDVSTGRSKILSMTPEVGSTGFWPTQQEIFPLAQENLRPNLYIAWAGGEFVDLQATVFNQPTYNAGDTGNVRIILQSKGIKTQLNVDCEWTTLSSYLTLLDSVGSVSFASFRQKDTITLGFVVSESIGTGYAIPTSLALRTAGTTMMTHTINVLVGAPQVIFTDDAEESMANWTTAGSTNGTWGQTTAQHHSGAKSFADSPGGSYLSNASARLTSTATYDFTSSSSVTLAFWDKYVTEVDYDYCNVEVSTNAGSTWISLAKYDGTQSSWLQKSFDASAYAAGRANVKFRFVLTSDVSLTYDGWHVDDIQIKTYSAPPIVDVSDDGHPPVVFSLGQNYPNPFNPSTTIHYEIGRESKVTLTIYNVLGQRVRSLIRGASQVGKQTVTWDGRNDSGHAVTSGMYFYRLEAGTFVKSRKMILLK